METLNDLFDRINKDSDDILSIGLPSYDYKRIPFSSPRMNYCTFGGIPVGTLVEFFGEQHGGKTTTALDIVANYQEFGDGRKVFYCDCENTLDKVWAEMIGVNTDELYMLKPKGESAEKIFDYVLSAINTGEVGLVVIDSLAAMVSQQELEKTVGDKTYGGISLALSRFAKLAEMACNKNRCTLIGINQMRDKIGTMFPMEDTPGGKCWKHMCSVRLEFRRGKFIDEKGEELNRGAENPAGNVVLMTMHKNKTCPPTRRVGFYTIKYLKGIDWQSDLIDVATKYGIVEKSGSWFKVIDVITGEVLLDKIHGYTSLLEQLSNNEELFNKVQDLVYSCMEKD